MKRLNKVFLLLLAIALVAVVVWALTSKAVTVQIAEVTRGTFQQVIEEDGKTRVRDRYVISAPVSGKILRIVLKAGNVVKQDAIVATIEPNAPALLDARSIQELTERVGAAEAAQSRAVADVFRAQATLEKSRADLARFKKLAAQGFISPAQLTQYELTYTVNSRESEAATQALRIAEHESGTARAALLRSQNRTTSDYFWTVRSPVSGTVLRVLQESENAVALGAPLLEVGDPHNIEIVVDVLSSDAVQIKAGDAVTIERWGQPEPLLGRVRLVEPSAFTKISALGVEEQRVNIIIDIVSSPEQWSGLSDGFRVVASIVIYSTNDAITVPTGALFRKGEQWKVFVVENGRAKERAVTIARRSGLNAMVEKGLQPGEKVVVYPGDTLKDGAKVNVI